MRTGTIELRATADDAFLTEIGTALRSGARTMFWNLHWKPYRKYLGVQVSLLIVGLGRGIACLCAFNIDFRDFENRVSLRFFQLLLLEHPSCLAKENSHVYRQHIGRSQRFEGMQKGWPAMRRKRRSPPLAT